MTSSTDAGNSLALELAELTALLMEASPARLVVATDWSRASTAFAVLQAWADALSADAPAQLVLAVPHEPGDADLAAVQVLLEEIDAEHDLAPVTIESFHEVVGQPFDLSVVPLGDRDVLLIEVAAAITRMHQIARGIEADNRNLGNTGALARRLSNYVE